MLLVALIDHGSQVQQPPIRHPSCSVSPQRHHCTHTYPSLMACPAQHMALVSNTMGRAGMLQG